MHANWFHSAIIYHVFIDRFNGNFIDNPMQPEFAGGTLKGVTEKIAYIKSLGCTCIWLSPFYKSTAYHGYHITDFMRVDKHFGTLDDLKELIETAKQHQLKLIADFVPNHCSKHHPYFVEAYNNPTSEYRNWFYFDKKNQYLSFLNFNELPKLRLDYAPTYAYLLEAAQYWLALGFDGFRLDHVIGPTFKFWKKFSADIKQHYPSTVLIGEAWAGGLSKKFFKTVHLKNQALRYLTGVKQQQLQLDYKGYLDAMLDFRVSEMIRKHFAKHAHVTPALEKQIHKHLKHYSTNYLPVLFLDNHDMERFMFVVNQNTDRMLEALYLLKKQGCPLVIYYGTETGLTHTKGFNAMPTYADLLARQPMQWNQPNLELVEKVRAVLGSSI